MMSISPLQKVRKDTEAVDERQMNRGGTANELWMDAENFNETETPYLYENGMNENVTNPANANQVEKHKIIGFSPNKLHQFR